LEQQNPVPAKVTAPAQTTPLGAAASEPQSPPPVIVPLPPNQPVANIGSSGTTQLALFIMAFSLLTIAVVLVVFLLRRSRSAPQPSLITQSIDRRKS
jgi:hypothetical protein